MTRRRSPSRIARSRRERNPSAVRRFRRPANDRTRAPCVRPSSIRRRNVRWPRAASLFRVSCTYSRKTLAPPGLELYHPAFPMTAGPRPRATNFSQVAVYVHQDEEDAALVARCVAGDPNGFDGLVERYQRVLFTVALRMLGDYDEA